MLQLKKISKSYSGRIVLQDFNLDFNRGTISCLFGPSGCGKTTLLDIMGGLIHADSGALEGFSNETISYIFQDTKILPWKTVLENVLFPLKDILPKKTAIATARKFIGMVGLDQSEHLFPAQLSGGMRQRVSIARAFAYPGSLILMDEAFQNLDTILKNNILNAFKEIWEVDRRTVIFVTHSIDEAMMLGQEIIFLNHSPLQVINTLDTLLNTPEQIKDYVREVYGQ